MPNAIYEGTYPLGTSIARPLIVNAVDIAIAEGAEVDLSWGPGKGNDQVRFGLRICIKTRYQGDCTLAYARKFA